MLNILQNKPLAPFTTFNIGGPAKFFTSIKSEADIKEAVMFAKQRSLPILILGGGSNLVISDNGFAGLVIYIENKGMTIESETSSQAILKVAAGENWDETVKFAVNKKLWGIENLSLIPGKVGALGVQNVSAYGQQASEVIQTIEAFSLTTGEKKIFSNSECRFGYRKSIFNNSHSGQFLIWSINLLLSKTSKQNLSYKDVKEYFSSAKTLNPTLQEIRQAIIQIRQKKLPNPQEIGNAGSFFKNPELKQEAFEIAVTKIRQSLTEEIAQKFIGFKNKFKGLRGIKIPAVFLIEACGLKETKFKEAGLYEKHALVLINHSGKAKAKDILELAKFIKVTVFQKTGIELAIEPNLIGFTKQELEKFNKLFLLPGEKPNYETSGKF